MLPAALAFDVLDGYVARLNKSRQSLLGADLDSLADIEVSYARHEKFGVWLPEKMTEMYAGPIPQRARPPVQGTATTRATYSDFKQFDTGVKINIPK